MNFQLLKKISSICVAWGQGPGEGQHGGEDKRQDEAVGWGGGSPYFYLHFLQGKTKSEKFNGLILRVTKKPPSYKACQLSRQGGIGEKNKQTD